MYDAAFPSEASARLQRAQGELMARFRARGGQTALADLRQSGCLKMRFPRPENGAWAGAVTLNTSGGIVGGDVLATVIVAEPGAQVMIAAQAAERFYRSLPGSTPSRIHTRLLVAEGAAMEWLPQETILFDNAALERVLDIDLAENAWFLGVESLIFGRAAMGEQVRYADLRDTIRIRRAGRLLLQDTIRLSGPVAARLDKPAIALGARGVATIVHVAPNLAAVVDNVRAALAGQSAEAGVSAWNGVLVARLIAGASAELRAGIVAVLRTLRAGRPLPRVWLC